MPKFDSQRDYSKTDTLDESGTMTIDDRLTGLMSFNNPLSIAS